MKGQHRNISRYWFLCHRTYIFPVLGLPLLQPRKKREEKRNFTQGLDEKATVFWNVIFQICFGTFLLQEMLGNKLTIAEYKLSTQDSSLHWASSAYIHILRILSEILTATGKTFKLIKKPGRNTSRYFSSLISTQGIILSHSDLFSFIAIKP